MDSWQELIWIVLIIMAYFGIYDRLKAMHSTLIAILKKLEPRDPPASITDLKRYP